MELNSVKTDKEPNDTRNSRDGEPVYLNTTLPRGQISEDDADYEVLKSISASVQNSQQKPSAQVKEGNVTPNNGNHTTLLVYMLLGFVIILFLAVIGTAIGLGVAVSQAVATIGAWNAWEPWSQCSVSCGFGNAHRNRTCMEDQNCVGDSTENKMCHENMCPAIHGSWSEWSAWGLCSATCNAGMEIRQRTCSNPRPSNGGESCLGETRDYRICNRETCSGFQIRLVGVRLEVSVDGFYWGTVCDDNFDINEATVVCRMLEKSGGSVVNSNNTIDGIGPIFLDDLGCVGPETSLLDCLHSGWGIHDCGHGEDVGVSCS